ncbi:MAG: hypothetical protein M3083_08940 [Actinomycetota bacterium]|nr:hypothetical protein [Actinomycetota bacterium]MDQ6947124.1 hypothetical protein [Actinomycetota bacterium]
MSKLRSAVRKLCRFGIVGLICGLTLVGGTAKATPHEDTLTSAQVQQLVSNYYAAVRSLDPGLYASKFAVDGSLQDPVGTPPSNGRPAIEATYAGAPAAFSAINMFPAQVFTPDLTNEAAVLWTATVQVRGSGLISNQFSGITYFKFHNNGLIGSARVFWNPSDITFNP